MSRKKMDMKAEQELGNFLDEFFYKYIKDEYGYNIIRTSSRELQFKGIDVIVETPNGNVNIDEKAQLYYINKGLPTFAFEINFINSSGELTDGWLFNNQLLTDYYLLIWPYADCSNLKEIKAENFTKIDCLIICRNNIQQYLINKGWTSTKIYNKAKEIRQSGVYGQVRIQGENEFYFFNSNNGKYTEAPINIIIRKTELIKLADSYFEVNREGVIWKK